MKQVATSALLAGAVCCAGSAQAQLSDAFRKACPDAKTMYRWCPPQALSEGWKLKYKSENPKNLADGYWRYEVWIRDQSAAVCIFAGGRGGTTTDYCQELSEVSE